VQRELDLEISNALSPLQAPPSLDMKALFEADIQNYFPTISRQKVLNMVAGISLVQHQWTILILHTRKATLRHAVPTHPSFRAALPLCHLLYGAST
jgi:hypothetical protein